MSKNTFQTFVNQSFNFFSNNNFFGFFQLAPVSQKTDAGVFNAESIIFLSESDFEENGFPNASLENKISRFCDFLRELAEFNLNNDFYFKFIFVPLFKSEFKEKAGVNFLGFMNNFFENRNFKDVEFYFANEANYENYTSFEFDSEDKFASFNLNEIPDFGTFNFAEGFSFFVTVNEEFTVPFGGFQFSQAAHGGVL